MKILIVDDEKEIADYVCRLTDEVTLSRAETFVFYSGTKALQRLKEEKFDVVISDVVMPVTDGFAILEYIAGQCPGTRFIFLSVHKDFNFIYRANKMKNIDYVVKTETAAEIKKVIEKNIRGILKEPRYRNLGTSSAENPREKLIVNQICEHIVNNLDSELNVNTLASFFHYNPSYLSKKFKLYTGSKLSDYIAEQRLEKAKRFLTESDYSVTKIAGILGYRSGQTFCRAFRKKLKATPQEYRRSMGVSH